MSQFNGFTNLWITQSTCPSICKIPFFSLVTTPPRIRAYADLVVVVLPFLIIVLTALTAREFITWRASRDSSVFATYSREEVKLSNRNERFDVRHI